MGDWGNPTLAPSIKMSGYFENEKKKDFNLTTSPINNNENALLFKILDQNSCSLYALWMETDKEGL